MTFTLALLSTYLALSAAAPAEPQTAQDVIGRFAALWNSLQSYTCTGTVHEIKGDKTQDRVYHVFFEKPYNTRAEVVSGDGKGSVGIWTGGDRLRGHPGGILSIVLLNLDIHNHLAMSLRGATIAQLNMGSLLSHLQSLGGQSFTLSRQGDNDVLSADVRDEAPDTDVVREVYIFAPSGLPIESFQYGTDNVVLKHVVVTDFKIDIALPPSTWQA